MFYFCRKHVKHAIMSKQSYFKRYLWLFDFIKRMKFVSFDEICKRYEKYPPDLDGKNQFSKSTFHRDILAINDLFGIQISYNKAEKGYFIENESIEESQLILIDAYRYINSLYQDKDINQYISLASPKGGGEYLMVFLEAIKDRRNVTFDYCRYVTDETTRRNVEPYFIKEFKNRWYLIARDINDSQTKTFALDRIKREPYPASGANAFVIPSHINPEKYFKDVFGIFKMNNLQAEEVVLSFSPLKGKFIKSQPLHHSQEIIIDNDVECRIKLNIQITHDFEMELLSHADELKVIQPEHLVRSIGYKLEKALSQYNY